MRTSVSWVLVNYVHMYHIYDSYLVQKKKILTGPAELTESGFSTRLREIDIFLMDIVLKMKITDNQFEFLNCERQWYNFKYLSEVCTKGRNLLMNRKMKAMIRINTEV